LIGASPVRWKTHRGTILHEEVGQRLLADHPELRHGHAAVDRTTSGNVTINGTLMHVAQDDLPFGGVGASGMGKYHGIEGFRTLSHPKGVHTQGRWNATRLLRAPFTKRTDTLLNFFLR
jgi:hypothetical protein